MSDPFLPLLAAADLIRLAGATGSLPLPALRRHRGPGLGIGARRLRPQRAGPDRHPAPARRRGADAAGAPSGWHQRVVVEERIRPVDPALWWPARRWKPRPAQ